MDRIEQVVADIHEEAFEDYVGLWTVPWHLRELGVSDEEVRRTESLKVIKRLLEFSDIGIGQFRRTEDVFDFWNVSPIEALMRIVQEWDALGHEPNLGDVGWFTSKD